MTSERYGATPLRYGNRYVMWSTSLFLALFVAVQGRAVNISNTWVLPEEGFPVFYRYFRDRISWYEADAVCQFHHANLVTVDTTAQYDAVRAYLKELDISSAVWVGLIRSNPDGDFTWTDYRGLGGEGYWSSAPDSRTAPLCAAADPAADYRWDARACGGPSVASFICELPVPQWALGNEGCMVKALPALTVLYLPESAAVQLTTDCGAAGVRSVQCTGNIKREDLLKDLSCYVDETTSSTTSDHGNTSDVRDTTENVGYEQDTNYRFTDETTTSEDNIEQNSNVISTTAKTFIEDNSDHFTTNKYEVDSHYEKVPNLHLIENNNLYNNIPNVPSIIFKDDLSSTEYANKLDEERHIQHKLLHDEIARLGNVETLFNQPTDHFIPPLVMAKAKLRNDMNAMSFEEKLAQEHEDYQNVKHSNDIIKFINKDNTITTEVPNLTTTDNVLINVMHTKTENSKVKINNKKPLPKKYNPKQIKLIEEKHKSLPILNLKKATDDKVYSTFTPQLPTTTIIPDPIPDSNYLNISKRTDSGQGDEASIELTVIIREPNVEDDDTIANDTIGNTESSNNNTSTLLQNNTNVENETNVTVPTIVEFNDDTINITLFIDHTHKSTHDTNDVKISTTVPESNMDAINSNPQTVEIVPNLTQTLFTNISFINGNISDSYDITEAVLLSSEISSGNTETTENYSHNITEAKSLEPKISIANVSQDLDVENENITILAAPIEHLESNIEQHFNSSEEEIDDFQSPLLSGAEEPIHKPMRSRRPQNQQNRAKKFNPFRILG